MIGVAEETGDIDGMLSKIAAFYESEVDAAAKALITIIEPLMIVVVGGIPIAMYLPPDVPDHRANRIRSCNVLF